MRRAHQEAGGRVRFDWSVQGADAIAGDADADVTVVVDVLSFTTTVTVAAEAGMAVIPYRWGDRAGAERLAVKRGAVLAVGRSAAGAGQPSLSPLSIRQCPRPVDWSCRRRMAPPLPTGLPGAAGRVWPPVCATRLLPHSGSCSPRSRSRDDRRAGCR